MDNISLEGILASVDALRKKFPNWEIVFEVKPRLADTPDQTEAAATGSVMDRWREKHRNDPPIPCQQCGRPFKQLDAKQKFCCWSCKNDSRNMDRLTVRQKAACQHCGKEFQQTRSDMVYCSKKCIDAASRIRAGKEPVGVYPHNCPQCGTKFFTKHCQQKFCTPACLCKSRLADKKQEQEHRRILIEAKADQPLKCQHCGEMKTYADFYPKTLTMCKRCHYPLKERTLKDTPKNVYWREYYRTHYGKNRVQQPEIAKPRPLLLLPAHATPAPVQDTNVDKEKHSWQMREYHELQKQGAVLIKKRRQQTNTSRSYDYYREQYMKRAANAPAPKETQCLFCTKPTRGRIYCSEPCRKAGEVQNGAPGGPITMEAARLPEKFDFASAQRKSERLLRKRLLQQ